MQVWIEWIRHTVVCELAVNCMPCWCIRRRCASGWHEDARYKMIENTISKGVQGCRYDWLYFDLQLRITNAARQPFPSKPNIRNDKHCEA